MMQNDYDAMVRALDEQYQSVSTSPEAARQLLADLGILDLFERERTEEMNEKEDQYHWHRNNVAFIGPYSFSNSTSAVIPKHLPLIRPKKTTVE